MTMAVVARTAAPSSDRNRGACERAPRRSSVRRSSADSVLVHERICLWAAPDAHRAVHAAGGDLHAVRAELHALNLVGVADQRAHDPATDHVPDLHGAIPRGGG